MSRAKANPLTAADYAKAAQEYLRSLPLEHFMEATSQATQREITVESLALVKSLRRDVQYFNELLVQYPRRGESKPGQVVPDNMVVVSEQPIDAEGSYDVSLQHAKPFWVLEFVSKGNRRKDYEDSFNKYEKELKVPYFLLFYPETRDLTLYRHSGKKYVSVPPNEHGRHSIPELEMEVGLLDDWVRYWFRGELLPLPADLQRDLAQANRRAERLQAQLDQERRALEKERQALDRERQAREAVERELEQLRSQLKPNGKRRPNGSK
jgi:Uma2 family endonuclease